MKKPAEAAQSASLLKLKGEALEKFARIRRLFEKQLKALGAQGLERQGLPARARSDLCRADDDPLHRPHRRAPVRQRAQPG